MILETAEILGIPRAELARGCGVSLEHLANPRRRVEWATFAELNDRLSHLLGDDPERLRDFGRLMVPADPFLLRIATRVVSLRALYLAGNRWAAPAFFPGVKVTTEFFSDRFVRIASTLWTSPTRSKYPVLKNDWMNPRL